MGKRFFSGWQLWQQMTFVLACGIAGTVILGLCKLQYERRKLRKYDKIEKGKAVQTPEMLESQPMAETRTKEDVPFGIRAIESGIEVDGVWISRSNTPVGSSRSSVNDFKIPHSFTSSQIEMPKAIHGSSSRESSRASTMNSAFDRAVSAERIPTNESRSSSPRRGSSSSSNGRPPLASSSHFANSHFTRNSNTLHALEGVRPASFSVRYEPKSTPVSSTNSGKSSSRSSNESDYIPESRPYIPAYIHPKHAFALPVDPRTDLDLLQSHRLSHVAETGQLTPRVRKPGNSGEWASIAEKTRSPQEISTLNGVDYFVPRQKTPSPPLNPIRSPPELPPLSTSRLHGQALDQAGQAVPLLETYAGDATQLPETYQPRGPQHEYAEEPTQHEAQTSRNQRQSQVIRKVNSGFEILRPGTFGELASPEEETPKIEKRQSRRLQKKRRSTNGSTSSKFMEQV